MNQILDSDRAAAPWHAVPAAHSSAQQIHFMPANGIPAASYAAFFEGFGGKFHISSTDNRSCWPGQGPPSPHFDWHEHANDLIAILDSKYRGPIIGMGHSLGGTVMVLAALKRPELFSRLILIDPATTSSRLTHLYLKYSPQWLILKTMGFIRGSHQRQNMFTSREQFTDRYRNHPTFRNFTDRAFVDYARYGLVDNLDGGLCLLCHPHWESHNFSHVEYLWSQLSRCQHPTLLLRAQHTYMYSKEQFDDQSRKLGANVNAQQIDNAHHLVTHELPEQVAAQVLTWLASGETA